MHGLLRAFHMKTIVWSSIKKTSFNLYSPHCARAPTPPHALQNDIDILLHACMQVRFSPRHAWRLHHRTDSLSKHIQGYSISYDANGIRWQHAFHRRRGDVETRQPRTHFRVRMQRHVSLGLAAIWPGYAASPPPLLRKHVHAGRATPTDASCTRHSHPVLCRRTPPSPQHRRLR